MQMEHNILVNVWLVEIILKMNKDPELYMLIILYKYLLFFYNGL